ncbi:hypothetical protein J6590_070612 [Homalodisca vitripennis]|nr:hypothetical protein J6590_070612 [Homalodisca vitripennis]
MSPFILCSLIPMFFLSSEEDQDVDAHVTIRLVTPTTAEDEDSDSGKYQLTDVASSTGQFFTAAHHDMSTYFRDGRRKIDFVMVYEETLVAGSSAQSRRASVMVPHPVHMLDKKLAKHENWRQRFMSNLRKAGLDMEEEVVEAQNRKLVYFIKLHATWPVLCHYAEELNMRAPLQVSEGLGGGGG